MREALARLEEQGLVSTQRHKGAVVSSLSLNTVIETERRGEAGGQG